MKSQINKEVKLSKDDINDFIKRWNVRFPYDRLWRRKYNIPFGSPAHLNTSQIDIFVDIQEEKLLEKVRAEYLDREKEKADYIKTGVILKETILTQEEEDKIWQKVKFPNS